MITPMISPPTMRALRRRGLSGVLCLLLALCIALGWGWRSLASDVLREAPVDHPYRVMLVDPGSTATPWRREQGRCALPDARTTVAVSLAGFSASGGQMPWGGFALLGVVLAGMVVTQRRQQR